MAKSPTLELYINQARQRAHLEDGSSETENPTLTLVLCVVVFLLAFDRGGIISAHQAIQFMQRPVEDQASVGDVCFYAYCVGGTLFAIGALYLLKVLQRIFDERAHH
jgi:hypothetical protein